MKYIQNDQNIYLKLYNFINNMPSTLLTLQKLDNEIFDIYHTNTRLESQNIFTKRGYIRVLKI